MIGFLLTLFAGFLIGALLMRCLYRKVHSIINAGGLIKIAEYNVHATRKIAQLNILMEESEGVAGLHRNGEIADWEWLKDNGWLD
jgi:hypothetical protein